jgi:hypothetical protein
MSATVILNLSSADFEALDGAQRAHRGSALFVAGASPMDVFQRDLIETAKRLGFVPPEPGSFWLNIQPGGDLKMLCWKAHESGSVLN